MSKLVKEEQWLENICHKCNLSFENGCVYRGNNYCENYKKLKRDLEVLEIFKKNTDVELLKANENAPIFATILRIKPLTNTIDKEYQKVKEWLEE